MKKLVLFTLIAISVHAQGQPIRCTTDANQAAIDAADPSQKAIREQVKLILANMKQPADNNRQQLIVTIPVVFHVLYANSGENISNNRIYEQMDVLNKDFSRTNVDAVNTRAMFVPVAANTQIQFCLAQRTPLNAPTTGIVRISTPNFPGNPDSVSPEWDHTKYLNIYTGNLGGSTLGYSNYPPGSIGNDKVVVLYSTVGGPNLPALNVPYHLGRTATHEVGHWLNLQHTFDGGCSGLNGNNCDSLGDEVCDTPPVANPHFACPGVNNSCIEVAPFPPPYVSNMPDMYENYMDYSDDDCMNIFTDGQSTRMKDALTMMRPAILSSLGCLAVGLEEILDPTYLAVSPNPSEGFFTLNFNFPSPVEIRMSITDLSGRVVLRQEFKNISTSAEVLDLSHKPAGIYLLNLETNSGKLSRQIVIAR